jgi:hypothetical protein
VPALFRSGFLPFLKIPIQSLLFFVVPEKLTTIGSPISWDESESEITGAACAEAANQAASNRHRRVIFD